MTLVTLSAAYGAGGSRVGPQLAQHLGVPFFDRAIPTGVAERLAVPRHRRDRPRAREAYVRHFYGADPHDCALYHLVTDSTAIGLDACVAPIADAARARR